jgi:energy-coupling factor transporter ATP-binding protein EcfA2
VIKLVDVHKAFGPKQVLQGFSLDIPEGETMVVIGYSGTGKSVAIKHIVGLLEADRGEVWVDGLEVAKLKVSRDPELLKLDSATYIAYKKMVLAAAKELKGILNVTPKGDLAPDEKFFKIVSAFRSREYQAVLRKKEPNAGRAALAMNSPHSSGFALDIYVGGKPVSTKDDNRLIQVQTPAYKWLVKNASKFGFYNYFYEPWHWEYVPSLQAK